MNIFVAKLNFDTREDSLQSAFEQYGDVDSVKIINDKMTGKSKGYGFVEMPNEDDALQAIEGLNESSLDGRTIVVKKAEPRENRGGNRRGGFDRRGGSGYNRDDRGGYNKRY